MGNPPPFTEPAPKYGLELWWDDKARPTGGSGMLSDILNLARTQMVGGSHLEVVIPFSQAVLDEVPLGVDIGVKVHTGGGPTFAERMVLRNITFQQVASGQKPNLILIFDSASAGGAFAGVGSKGRTFGGDAKPSMPKPPRFASVEEADRWMQQHEEHAKGALDSVLHKKGTA